MNKKKNKKNCKVAGVYVFSEVVWYKNQQFKYNEKRKLLLRPPSCSQESQKFKNTLNFRSSMDGIVQSEMSFNFGR
jgi:hypothetical protein